MSNLVELNTVGLLCPLPVLRIIKKMRSLQPGDTLEVIADDPVAEIDIPHYCNEHGHRLAAHNRSQNVMKFTIIKN